MSVSDYSEGDLFVVRIVKRLATNPDNKWANSYELQAHVAGSESDLLGLAMNLLTFEKHLHFPAVQFVQILVSTWLPDSKPYNPESFISSPLATIGTRTPSSDPLPLSTTLAVTRVCPTGRFGHIFYRGALEEADQNAPAGKAILSTPSAWVTIISDAIGDANIDGLFGSPSLMNFGMVMVSKDGSQVRGVMGLVPQGISQVPPDHAWFNRTTTPTP